MSENKKTIIIFSCFYEPYISGAERFVKEVIERLASRFNFIIITSKLDKPNKYWETKDLGEKGNYKILRVGFGFRFDKWLYPILAPVAALFFHPAIVHAVMESYAGIALVVFRFLGFLVFWLRKPKTILTLQSGDLDDKVILRQGYGGQAAKGLIPFWLWRNIHISPDHITAISSYLKNRAIKLGVPENKISIIPNGVDLNKLEIGNWKLEITPRRIVCVARLSPEKGLEYLLDATPLIKREFAEADLVLVGGGVLENDLKNQANQLGISDSVTFLGARPHGETLKIISEAEVFVCPSLAEGLGIVFIEAQAVGVPVIGTKVGGIPDVIKNGETGLLVPPRDSRAIADAVMRVFKDKELAQKMVEEAKKRIGRFDWDVIARQVAEIYK